MRRVGVLLVLLLCFGPAMAQEKKPDSTVPYVITKQFIQDRIDKLQKQLAQLEADLQATSGAIQEERILLGQLEEAEKQQAKKSEPKKPGGAK